MTGGRVVTRFAPSPTGDLHLGGAWTALASWVWARRRGGRHLVRIEDLDRARAVHGSDLRILEDLAWLGLDWDGPVVRQSDRNDAYEAAIAKLARAGLLYPCDCSRAEIAAIASAPHPGEELVYPGTCRDRDPARQMKRAPSLRVRMPDEVVSVNDTVQGPFEQNLARDVGDTILRRGDGTFSYQLAVVVDDAEAGVNVVVRGADLLSSTPRQIWLARSLGWQPPEYAHVAMVTNADGTRLEKRSMAPTVRRLREAGVRSKRIIGELAFGLGLSQRNEPVTPPALGAACAVCEVAWRAHSWPVPASLLVQ